MIGHLDARLHANARSLPHRDNAIDARRLAVGSLAGVFDFDPGILSQRLAQHLVDRG